MQHTTLSRLIRQEFYRKRLQYRRDAIPGGLGDTAEASDFDREQVAKGIKVEMEHTSDPRVALEITLDHLRENPRYYDKLATLKLSRALSMEFNRVRYAKFVESEHPRDEEGRFTPLSGTSDETIKAIESVLAKAGTHAPRLVLAGETKDILGAGEARGPMIRVNLDALKKLQENDVEMQQRWGKRFAVDPSLEGVIAHEMTHLRVAEMPESSRTKLMEAAEQLRQSSGSWLSSRSEDNSDEFLSELGAAYLNGKNLPVFATSLAQEIWPK